MTAAAQREVVLPVMLTNRNGMSLPVSAQRMARFTRTPDGTLEAVEPVRFTVLVRMVSRVVIGGVVVCDGEDDKLWRWTPLPPETFLRDGWYTLRKFTVPPLDVPRVTGRHRPPPVDTSARDRQIAEGLAQRFFPWRRDRRRKLTSHVTGLIQAIRDEERMTS